MAEHGYSEEALTADLRAWWDGEVGGVDDPFADPKPAASGTIFDVLPAIDSLGCVNGLLTIEKHVGFEVPSRILRRGGYSSFNEMAADLLPKVRAMMDRRPTRRRKEAA
jgi:hypothetical protein